jgi:hypothetical protein
LAKKGGKERLFFLIGGSTSSSGRRPIHRSPIPKLPFNLGFTKNL